MAVTLSDGRAAFLKQALRNVNYSLVGLTPAGEEGAEGTIEGIPTVDSDIDGCSKLTDDERRRCWEELEEKLMEEVVRWVPYRFDNRRDVIGPAVRQYAFDQFSGEIACRRRTRPREAEVETAGRLRRPATGRSRPAFPSPSPATAELRAR